MLLLTVNTGRTGDVGAFFVADNDVATHKTLVTSVHTNTEN